MVRHGNCAYLCGIKSKKMKRKNPIDEARRYVENAKKILKENGDLDTEIGIYMNEKSVRKAGNYLWLGVIMALDAVFHVRKDRRTLVNIEEYLSVIEKHDKNLYALVDSGYDIMSIYMKYDGNTSKGISDAGFHIAKDIIDRCEAMIN